MRYIDPELNQRGVINNADRKYLAQLQSEVDLFKARLIEFDALAAHAQDQFLKDLLRQTRGRILAEIEQRRRSWESYAVRGDQPVYARLAAMLKI
jgi:hypothetical protein